MNEGKKGWNLIKKVGKVELIGKGEDSSVFSVTGKGENRPAYVAKRYDQIGFNSIEPQKAERVLKEYYYDTERARKIIEARSNPFNQSIKINGKYYWFEYRIIPQGIVLLEQDKNVDFYKEDKFVEDGRRKVKISFGQEFFEGLNLDDLRRGGRTTLESESSKKQGVFAGNNELCLELVLPIIKVFSYLSRRLNVNFSYDSKNVIPFINEEDRKLVISITDLAADLKLYYKGSPRLEKLRNEK